MFRAILVVSTVGLVYGSTQVAVANEAGAITGGVGGAAIGNSMTNHHYTHHHYAYYHHHYHPYDRY
jgi:hypothetical protein